MLRKNVCFIHCWGFLFSLFLYLPITLCSPCLWRWWDCGGIFGLEREGWWHMWLCKANQALPSLLVCQPDSCQRVPERSQRGYTCVWNTQNRKFSGFTDHINGSIPCFKLKLHLSELNPICFVMHNAGFIVKDSFVFVFFHWNIQPVPHYFLFSFNTLLWKCITFLE